MHQACIWVLEREKEQGPVHAFHKAIAYWGQQIFKQIHKENW